jgi:hypothetical protein
VSKEPMHNITTLKVRAVEEREITPLRRVAATFCNMGLGQTEHNCKLCVDIPSCFYSAVKLPGASLPFIISILHHHGTYNHVS